MAALARVLALPAAERRILAEAAVALFAARLALGLLPFPLALRLLRVVPGEPAAAATPAPGADSGAGAAGEVAQAIARAARHVPFRAVCLQQAFAALLMLRRRGLPATIQLGLARGAPDGGLAAHAWSRCGAAPVTGAEAADRFVPVAAFVASAPVSAIGAS
jgi:hypothetical protein